MIEKLKPGGRILFVTNQLPWPLDNGGKITTYNRLTILSKLFDIDLVCFVNDRKSIAFTNHIEDLGIEVFCFHKRVIFQNKDFAFFLSAARSLFSTLPYVVTKYSSRQAGEKVRELLGLHRYRHVHIDHLQLFEYAPPLSAGSKRPPIVLDEHNVETEIITRRRARTRNVAEHLFLGYEEFKLRRYEIRASRLSDLVLAMTTRDRALLGKMTGRGDNITVSPFYIPLKKTARTSHRDGGKHILFLGAMSWFPNEDGVLWFYQRVFQEFRMASSGWRFEIVGGSPGPAVRKLAGEEGVEVTGYVEDLRPYLERALVSVVPLRVGGGMRVKILHLFSHGLPVISSTIGCEGIPVKDRRELIVAEGPEDFHRALEEVASDSSLRETLTGNSRELLKREYSLEAAARRYRELFLGTEET